MLYSQVWVAHSKTVTATTSTQEKIDFLLQIPSGATHGVNYKTQDFAAEVKKITGGKGVDVIIDFVGRTHWQKNIDSLARDGRMTLLATLSGMLRCSRENMRYQESNCSGITQAEMSNISILARSCINGFVSRAQLFVVAPQNIKQT